MYFFENHNSCIHKEYKRIENKIITTMDKDFMI